jgi:molybdenum cofactor cytidylyltransferase
MICGIVLAAGRSSRMGEPKALLAAGELTFLERVCRALSRGGCGRVLVVTGGGSDPAAVRIAGETVRIGAVPVVNPAERSEQIDSLRRGIGSLPPEARAAVVSPVDVPDVTDGLVRRLVDAFERTGAPVVVPSDGVRHGHPVLFARATFGELLEPVLPAGARTVVHRHRDDLVEVPMERLPVDIDTPEDYRRWRGAPGGR